MAFIEHSAPPVIPAGMMACPDCKKVISQKANSCPQCGRAIQATTGKIVWKIFLWLVILGGIGALFQRLAP